MLGHVFWLALIDKQSSQRFISSLPRIVRFEKELLIGRCIHGNLLDFMELRSEISASMESRARLSQAQKPSKTPKIEQKQPSMSQTNTSRKDSKATAMREKGVKKFSPNPFFFSVKMLKTAKIFIEFRPAEIGVYRPDY